MSKESVQAVIGKAVTDSKFRDALFANPEEVLGGYELTEAEVAALKSIDAETMESFAGSLDERISKALAIGIYAGFASGGAGEAGAPTGPGWGGVEKGG